MNDPQQNPLSEDLQALEQGGFQVPASDFMQEIENNALAPFFTVSYSIVSGSPVNKVDWYPRPYTQLNRIEQTPTNNIVTTLVNGYHAQYPPYYDTQVSYGVPYQYELIGAPGGSMLPRYSPLVTPRPPVPARPVEFPPAAEVDPLHTRVTEVEHQISNPSLNPSPAENPQE